jgi:hypothetical protein
VIKKYIAIIIFALFLAIPSWSGAKVYNYGVIALTGGTDGALDNINGQNLIDGDMALLINQTYGTLTYILDDDSAASESSPFVIKPDSNAGDKRWILVDPILTTIVTLGNNATPTVAGDRVVITGGTTTITDFDNGITGQMITVIAAHGLIITDGTNIFLSSSTNWTMSATDTLTLICQSDNKWYEVSRGDNGA